METSNRWFGLIVAYLVPGFIGLAGVSPFLPEVGEWLQPVAWGDWGIGPTIYALLAATGVGMIVSCFRWLLIDQIHRWTGIVAPDWNDQLLEQKLEAFNYLVEHHYRYYHFYANGLMAILWAYLVNRILATSPLLGPGTDLGVLVLCAVLFVGSRDALLKYYARTGKLVG